MLHIVVFKTLSECVLSAVIVASTSLRAQGRGDHLGLGRCGRCPAQDCFSRGNSGLLASLLDSRGDGLVVRVILGRYEAVSTSVQESVIKSTH